MPHHLVVALAVELVEAYVASSCDRGPTVTSIRDVLAHGHVYSPLKATVDLANERVTGYDALPHDPRGTFESIDRLRATARAAGCLSRLGAE